MMKMILGGLGDTDTCAARTHSPKINPQTITSRTNKLDVTESNLTPEENVLKGLEL